MISKATTSFLQSLKQKKYRQKYNKFLLEGEKLVLEGQSSGQILFDAIYVLEEKKNLFDINATDVHVITERELQKLSNMKSPPGVIAVAQIPEPPILSRLELRDIVLYLDDIKDPGNMGTIIRTADWFGVRTLIASRESVEFYNPKVIQSSMGSFANVTLLNADHEEINQDMPWCAAALSGIPLDHFQRPKDMILVIGSESHGVSKPILDKCAHTLTIPKQKESKAESLNAAIATSIILWSLRR